MLEAVMSLLLLKLQKYIGVTVDSMLRLQSAISVAQAEFEDDPVFEILLHLLHLLHRPIRVLSNCLAQGSALMIKYVSLSCQTHVEPTAYPTFNIY